MSAFKFLEAEDWNAIIARIETLEGAGGGGSHTLDGSLHTDVNAMAESQGDLLLRGVSDWDRLPRGTTGQIIKATGSTIEWTDETSGPHTLDETAIHTDVATMTEATGDILYRTGGSQWNRLGIGSTNNILAIASGIPAWTATPTLTSITTPSILSSAAISLTTAVNEWIYFTAGGTFRWQDKDAGNAERMSLDSATGALTVTGSAKIASLGLGNVTLFEDETDVTQRELRIYAPNSAHYIYFKRGANDGVIGNSDSARRIDFDNAIYFLNSGTVRGGGYFRYYNPSNNSYINFHCEGASGVGEGVISLNDGNLNIRPQDTLLIQNTDLQSVLTTTPAFHILADYDSTEEDVFKVDWNGLVWTDSGYQCALGTAINEFSTDDTLSGDSDDAVPTEQAVKAYVDDAITGGTSTLQRHVVMDMQPYDGAIWDYENGVAIFIDTDNQKIHAVGMIPDGAPRFKVLVWSEHVTASDTTYMQFLIQGKESGETSPTSYYNDTSEWASTSANEQMIEDSGWQTLDAGDERIYVELERITAGGTDDLYVQAIVLIFEVDVGNTIGSQANTELLIPCQIAPYDGAAWNYANGVSIFLDAADQKVLATGYIPPNTKQIEVIILAQHPSGSGSTNITTTIEGQECGTTSTESYAADTSAWTSTLANEQICKTLGWYATDADQERFYIEIKWNSGTDLHINEVVLNCFTPITVSGTIAQPSDSTPADMPDSATAGVLDDYSREDHVHPLTTMINMDMRAEGGATLEFKEKHGLILDANSEIALGKAAIQEGIARYRWHVWYGHGSAPQNSDLDLYLHDAGDDETANGWNRINATSDNWASTTTDDVYLYTSSWFSLTGNFPKAVWGTLIFDTGNGIRIWRMALECDTESS